MWRITVSVCQASCGIAQSTREIGLRMALGANRREVLRAINLTHVMQGMVFGISTLEPATLIAVAVTFTIIALLASWLPARRATKIDPLVALRFE